MVTTVRCSVSWLTERVCGMATSMPDCSTGAVSMKMSSSTSTTSTSGVMLISASAVWVRIWPPLRMEKAMARRSSGGSSLLFAAGAAGGEDGGVLDGVEQLAAEVVHARAELAKPRGELVVADERGDGDDEAGGGGDEGLGDAGSDGAEGAAPAVPRPWKASMMPMTVPKRPTKVAPSAMVASQVMRLSIAVRASQEAVCAARSSASGIARHAAASGSGAGTRR